MVSDSSPRLPWNARQVMQRNNTIIVIESGETLSAHKAGPTLSKRTGEYRPR
jgi:hypothetical protein